MKSREINGVTYAFEIHQKNDKLPYLLMLHGFMGDHRAFDHLIEPLKTFCNPATIDLLGHGKSSKIANPERYHERHQKNDLFTFLEKMKLKRLILYGYSMGGRLALKLALAYPDRFDGLILESANPGILDKEKRAARCKQDDGRAQRIELDFTQFLNDWQKLDLFQSPIPANESLKNRYQQIQSDQTPTALAASLRGFGTGIMEPAYNKFMNFTQPVMLLAGSADKKYQRINKRMVDRSPDASFSSITAAHRVHLDNPTAFLHQIKNGPKYF